MARYEHAAVRTYYSLGVLNSGQALIFTVGMTLVMLLAGRGVLAGTHTVGDFVMINALMIQLYMPLNFMGMVYREIKQGLVDLETMFALMDEPPEVRDKPDARPLVVREGTIRFGHVTFAYERERTILKDVSFEVPAGKMVAIVGPRGRQVDDQPHPVPLLRHPEGARGDRRRRHPRRDAEVLARGDRRRAAGHGAVQRHGALQHPLRTAGCDGGGDLRRGGWRRSTSSSARCRRATRRWSASAA